MMTDISLKYQITESRYRDFLAEAERQRAAAIALESQSRRSPLTAIRSSIALALLRVGSRLLPEGEEHGDARLATGSLQLRTCR